MTWLRVGDNAATHPVVLNLAQVRDADERTLNEVFGFVVRLAAQAANHMTDYRISLGAANMLGGPRAETLLAQAVAAGLLTCEGAGTERSWRIIEDADLLHMRSREEVEWDRRRKADNSNPALTAPVRLRDGDACRYCSRTVNWNDRRGTRGGTYDHLNPGEGATVATLVVACKGCNSRLGSREDRLRELREPPAAPFYSNATREFLTDRGITMPHQAPQALAEAPNTAPRPEQASSDPAAHQAPQALAEAPNTAPRPEQASSDPAAHQAPQALAEAPNTAPRPEQASSDPAARSADSSRKQVSGPGRVGAGRGGPGRQATPAAPRFSRSSRKRARRGRNHRKDDAI